MMASHGLQRLGQALLTLLVVSFLIHAALDIAPGDAADALAGDIANQAQMVALRRELNLDASFLSRYVNYILGVLLRGDWGRSMIGERSVGNLLMERWPNSLLLAVAAMVPATVVGSALGILTARHAGSWFDVLTIVVTTITMASPSYWMALLLFWLFALQLNWLPVLGNGGIKHLILPATTLALPLAASISRFMRANMLEEMRERYVDTARAKGASERRIALRHVLRNALGPVITLVGLHLGHLFGGTFIIETIYGWPGIGGLMIQAIFDRDHPVVMGAGMLIASSYILINLMSDLFQGWLDPRTVCQRHLPEVST